MTYIKNALIGILLKSGHDNGDQRHFSIEMFIGLNKNRVTRLYIHNRHFPTYVNDGVVES